jgi:hypothetical protein
MPNMVVLGAAPIPIEDVVRVAREGFEVRIAGGARWRLLRDAIGGQTYETKQTFTVE